MHEEPWKIFPIPTSEGVGFRFELPNGYRSISVFETAQLAKECAARAFQRQGLGQ